MSDVPEGYTPLVARKYPTAEADARNRGDKRGVVTSQGITLLPLVLDLSSAQALKEYDYAGDVIYIDRVSTGVIRWRPDTSWQRGITLGANAVIGSALAPFPYKRFLLDWDVQPGKICVVWCGYGLEITPPNQDITSIGSITSTVVVQDIGMTYGTSFDSSSNSSAINILAAASNTAGVRVGLRMLRQQFAAAETNPSASLLAKATAPANYADGQILMAVKFGGYVAVSANAYNDGDKENVIQIPSGLRLDIISNTAPSAQATSVKYTAL